MTEEERNNLKVGDFVLYEFQTINIINIGCIVDIAKYEESLVKEFKIIWLLKNEYLDNGLWWFLADPEFKIF